MWKNGPTSMEIFGGLPETLGNLQKFREIITYFHEKKCFRDRWPSLLTNIDRNDENRFVENQGPNKGWNYPDALFVGKGGMTITEYKTMFALWCVVKSPLMLGSDLRNMTMEDEAYKVILISRIFP